MEDLHIRTADSPIASRHIMSRILYDTHHSCMTLPPRPSGSYTGFTFSIRLSLLRKISRLSRVVASLS
jgi:hypothetical protein